MYNKIFIYSKSECIYCERAIELAKSMSHYSLTVLKLGDDFTREEFFELFPDAKTYPQIVIDDEYIGGFTEFQAYDTNDYEDF